MIDKKTTLMLDVAVGDILRINSGEIEIALIKKSGQKSRISFTANSEQRIELLQCSVPNPHSPI